MHSFYHSVRLFVFVSAGTAVESAFIDTHAGLPKALLAPLFPAAFQCVACPKDCSECESNQSCKVSYTSPTRVFVLGVQSFCATISLILAVTTFRLRRSKVGKMILSHRKTSAGAA